MSEPEAEITCPHCFTASIYRRDEYDTVLWLAGVVTFRCHTCGKEFAVRMTSPVATHPAPVGTVFASVEAYRDWGKP